MAVYINTVSVAEYYFETALCPVSRDGLNFAVISSVLSGKCHDTN
jgi:hypothetical protein